MMKFIKNLFKNSKKIVPLATIILLCLIAIFGFYAVNANASERPQWKNVYVAEEKCEMNIRNFLLYRYGKDVKIEKKGFVCKVVSGKWWVYSDDRLNRIIETDISKLQIDHIVPWSYIKKHIAIEDFEEVYNSIANLRVISSRFNTKKSNRICSNTTMCNWQLEHCEDLVVILDIKNIKNTIDCFSLRQNSARKK